MNDDDVIRDIAAVAEKDPELARKLLLLSVMADYWRCPNTGRVIDAAKHDDKALCGCGKPNPRVPTEAPGLHIKSFLVEASVREFYDQEQHHAAFRERFGR
jgi:hypothetical protein